VSGDIDGDGTDELIRLGTSPYETQLFVYRYAPGLVDGGTTGLAKEDTLTYYTPSTAWVTGDIDRELKITGSYPADDFLTIEETGEIDFSIESYQSDGVQVRYNWTLDGTAQSSEEVWTFSADYNSAGSHIIVGIISDGKGSVYHEWQVQVHNKNRPPEIELSSPVDGTKWNGVREIVWEAWDPDGDEVYVTVEYREKDGPWKRLGDYNGSGSQTLDTTGLPDGEYWVKTTVIDTEGGSGESMVSFVISNPVVATTPPPTREVETQPPPTPEPEVNRTKVSVRSIPGGAALAVDGEDAGRMNTVLYLDPGIHKMTSQRPGYYTRTKEIEVKDEAMEVTFIMVPEMTVYVLAGVLIALVLWKVALILKAGREGD
jgi:hypothetical protein